MEEAPVRLRFIAWEHADYILVQLQERTAYGPIVDLFHNPRGNAVRATTDGPAAASSVDETTPVATEEVSSADETAQGGTEEAPSPDETAQDGTEEAPSADETAQDQAADNPDQDFLVVIRRPRLHHPTDQFLVYVGDKEAEEAGAQARRQWRLAPLEPTIQEVDRSFYSTWPEDVAWTIYIAIENGVTATVPHLRCAIVHLRKYGQRDYQAVFIAQRTSELGILSFCHLLRTCKATDNNVCVVTHNNKRVYGSSPIIIAHGDYIRVELLRKDNLMEHATLLSTMEEDYTQNDRVAFWPARRLTLGQPQQGTAGSTSLGQTAKRIHHWWHGIVMNPSVGSCTSTTQLHEMYWFSLTIALWIFVPILLHIHEQEHPTPKARRSVRRRNRRCVKVYKTAFLCSLLLTQHCTGVMALHLRTVDVSTGAFDDTRTQHYGNLLDYEGNLWTRDCMQGLQPPGNPLDCDTRFLQLTSHGAYLMDCMVQHLEFCKKAASITERLRHIARPLRTPSLPILRLEHALFRPSDAYATSASSSRYTAKIVWGGSKAPDKAKDEQRVFEGDDVLDDDNGLIVNWPELPARNPIDFLEDLPVEFATILQRIANPFDDHDDIIHIYTDGSASKYDGDTRSAWAFVIFKCKVGQTDSDTLQFLDWYGNLTQDDPMHTQWTGAMDQSSRSGEGEALAWAILWALQRHPPCKIIIHSDAMSVLSAAEGQWNFRRMTIFYSE